jgi:small subunit ribosomal protein S4e
MGKRGGKKHLKRIATPLVVPVHDKKDYTWLIKHSPGPHSVRRSIPLGVFIRDILKITRTAKEAERILSERQVQVDGKVRADEKFPIGLMDVISIPKSGKHYRLSIDRKGKLFPLDLLGDEASSKMLKIIRKHTIRGGKINFTFHDGKNMMGDNHMMVGDSVMVSLPDVTISAHLKREPGARCLVTEGKHAGSVVKLKEIIERKGGKPSEALVQYGDDEFITVAKYLFVLEEAFKVSG